MERRLVLSATLIAFSLGIVSRPALGQAPKGSPADETALMERAKAFVEAFQKGDAKAVAGFWTADGDYTDQLGQTFKGRAAIEKVFGEFFAENKGLKLRIDIGGLRFVTPDVAVEDGTTGVIPPDGGPPMRARYTIVHIKQDGQWYLSSVRDAPYAPETNFTKLRSLDWMIGAWADDTPGGETARVLFEWNASRNFIVSTYSISFKNMTVAGGNEWIGWDPLTNQIRSWTFDLEGGFGGGTWTIDGDKVVIKTSAVTRDGKKLTATNTVTRVDANTVSWKSTERTEDGKPLPDIKETKMKRQNG